MAPLRKDTWESDIARWLYIAIVITSAIMMAILFALIISDRNSIKREANIRATQIQQQRYDTIYDNCLDANRRHDRTVRRLNRLARAAKKLDPSQAKFIEKQTRQSEFLIEAIVPRHNCKRVAERAVHPLPAPNHND